jgi:transcriptional regulator with XRE-family HTH domain
MRYTRIDLLGITLDELAARMDAAGYGVTAQAISSWERGDTSPRPHHQIGWCKVTGRPHGEVFVMSDEAVA